METTSRAEERAMSVEYASVKEACKALDLTYGEVLTFLRLGKLSGVRIRRENGDRVWKVSRKDLPA